MSLLLSAIRNMFTAVNQLPEEQRHDVAASVVNTARVFGGKVRRRMLVQKNGFILITFAWTVEVVGVVAGFVTAVVTTYPDGNLPTSWWPWLMAVPMGMISVAELGRIPLTSVLFHRHKVMQAIAFVGIVFLAGLSFENWMFGFERIVELRLKSVSAADLVLTKAEANLRDIENRNESANTGDTNRRKEVENELKGVEAQISAENDNNLKNLEAIRKTCAMVREICAQPQQDKERARHNEAIEPLQKQADGLRAQINTLINSDRGAAQKLEDEMAAAREAVSVAKEAKAEEASQNQIFRLAAMWYRVSPEEVSAKQFESVRFWFSVFSAIAVALAGTVSALVYYARQRVPGDSAWTRMLTKMLAKMLRARRAYYARKRRPVYRVETVEVEKEKIVEVKKEVPVEKIIYRDGKEPPITVEVEKVKWIDRIVLIPRWNVRYPVHVNSLIKDDEEPPPSPPGVLNLTELKKVKLDGR